MKKIKKHFKLIKKNIKKILKNSSHRASFIYTRYYERKGINNNLILLESHHGKTINGNIFYIIEELSKNKKYENFKIYVAVKSDAKDSIEELLLKHGINNIDFVNINTKKYCKILSTAKYLFNDNTFPTYFIKKNGQIYLNTWHGTPLKTLGRKIAGEPHAIGNTQRNFLMSDYLLYPNEFTMEKILDDYMIKDIYKNKIVLTGYPRNTIFYDETSKKRVRKEMLLSEKQVIAYMPTWRGVLGNSNPKEHKDNILNHLIEIDKKLNQNQILFVNLHPIMKDFINYSIFKNIKPFPSQYETYEFLNATDILITDYSSVFFDYALTKNKIILFTYDEEEYLKDRGMYLNLEELPFPKVKSVNKLIAEINSKNKTNYKDFLKKYCLYDNLNVTKELCEMVILNNKTNIKCFHLNKTSNKENILIYAGNLAKNGITTSLFNLLNNVDLNRYNYYVTFYKKHIEPHNGILLNLPDQIKYIPIQGKINYSLFESFISFLYFKLNLNMKFINKVIEKIFKREFYRIYNDIEFSNIIHFSGYGARSMHILARGNAKKIIYVHNDMVAEITTRNNQHKNTLVYAYNNYDYVAIVSEDIRKSTETFVEDKNKIRLVSNIHDYKTVIEKSKKELKLDSDTEVNITLDKLNEILNSNSKKFITIGRFSPEKGHKRLIKAFSKFWVNNKDSYLIIIGGHGKLYNETINFISNLECKDNIVIIKSISNPFPILKKCDLFILSSFYEGLGLVILEADTLGVPVISTDIQGPRGFLQKYNGYLVENSEEGIYQGMIDYLDGKVKTMNIDFENYNKPAVEEFYELIEDKESKK